MIEGELEVRDKQSVGSAGDRKAADYSASLQFLSLFLLKRLWVDETEIKNHMNTFPARNCTSTKVERQPCFSASFPYCDSMKGGCKDPFQGVYRYP